MDTNGIALAAIGLAGTIAAGFFAMSIRFFGLINKQNKTHEKLALTMDKVATASKEVAKATKASAHEAEERNGHLGEQNIRIAELVSQGNSLTEKIVSSLDDSAVLLAKNTAGAAQAVKEVKVTLSNKEEK